MFRQLSVTSNAATSQATREAKSLTLPELEAKVKSETNRYIELLRNQSKLEKDFNNEALDAKTRCEVFQELRPMMAELSRLQPIMLIYTKELESRLVASLTGEQKSSYESQKMRFK